MTLQTFEDVARADASGRYGIVRAEASEKTVDVEWADGHASGFHYIWLRDNCPGEQSRAAGTSQRLVDASTIPAGIAPSSVRIGVAGTLEVTWSSDGLLSIFDPRWLRDHCYSAVEREKRRRRPRLWDASVAKCPPAIGYADIASDEGRFRWLAMLIDYGFAILRDVPAEPGQVEQVAKRMGYVRETNYGRVFDVVSVEKPNNLAYSDRGLAVHTDNPYRDPVPGIQLLHCVQAHAVGGETVLVDGFRVADALRSSNAREFELLSTTPRHFRFADESSDLRCETPLIHVDANRDVVGVRFNDRSASTLSLPEELVGPYYEAYRRFASMLYDEAFSFRFKLLPGDLVAFDNERVLHGRTGFDSRSGSRHLQGVYVDRDEVCSRLRVLGRRLGLSSGDPAVPGGPRLSGLHSAGVAP